MAAVIDISQPDRPTVLIIMRGFSGSVCLYCSAQTAAVAELAGDFRTAGVDVIVLYPGSVASVQAFKDSVAQLQDNEMSVPLPFRVALDVNQLLVQQLDVRGDLSKPTSLIIDTEGVVQWAYVGADMSDRPSVQTLLAQAQALP